MSHAPPDEPRPPSDTATVSLASAPPTAAGEQATLPPAACDSIPDAVRVTIPGHEIHDELGRGGMGVVYKARHLKLGRLVALKMILAGAHAGPADLARFRTEAEAVARLQHPNIVQVFEVGEHGGLPYFSLEFCGGGSLEKKLAGTPLPAREAAALLEVLARAVQAAHDKGVIHRDLKPANVLLADDGTPKITDFGLAKKLDEAGQTASGAIMGTPSYMAPEQAGGKSLEIGPPADLYALGAILYECLTGRPPFKAATALDTMLQVVSDDPVPPTQLQSQTPRDLETICLKCLAKEPRRRYHSATELADDLRRFLAGEPIVARPVGRFERGAKWVRRNPVVAALLVAVLVALAFGSGGIYWKYLDAKEQADNARKQKEIADAKTREVLEKSQELEETLAEEWLRLVGQDATPSPAELEGLRRLAETANENVRLLFLQKALERPEAALRLGRRTELAVHAAVGLNRMREKRVVELLLARLRDNQTDREGLKACILVATALGTRDGDCCREAVRIGVEVITKTNDQADLTVLGNAVEKLAERLAPEPAAEAAQTILDTMVRTTIGPNSLNALLQVLGGLTPRLGPEAVARVAEPVLDAVRNNKQLSTLNSLLPALEKLADHMGPQPAAKAAESVLDALTENTDAEAIRHLARALGRLAQRMESKPAAERCEKAARHVLDVAGNNRNQGLRPYYLEAVMILIGHMEPKPAAELSAKAAQAALDNMTATARSPGKDPARKSADLAMFAFELRELGGHTEPQRAAELYAKAAQLVLDDLKANSNLTTASGQAIAVSALADQMGPQQAAETAGGVLNAMTKSPNMFTTVLFDEPLGKLAERLEPEQANKMLKAVLDAINETKEPAAKKQLVEGLKKSLSKLAERLDPDQAAKATEAVLQTLRGIASSGALAARIIDATNLVEPLTQLSERMGPERCAKAAEAALDPITKGSKNPFEQSLCARALAKLLERLELAQAADLSAKAASPLRRALASSRETDASGALALGLGQLAERMAPETAAEAAQTVLDAVNRNANLNDLRLCAQALVKLVERLEPAKAAELSPQAARTVLGVLTKDTIMTDSAYSPLVQAYGTATRRMEPEAAAQAAQPVLDAITKTTDQQRRKALGEALEKLAEHMNPEQAANTAQSVLVVRSSTTPAYVRVGPSPLPLAVINRLSTESLVDLLKHPACVQGTRVVVLRELSRRLGPLAMEAGSVTAAVGIAGSDAHYPGGHRPFADQWEAADWLREYYPELDTASPLRKSAR
jgi:tRNA A-37 threonylcarbamoyl transferase component Bud32